MARVVLTQPSPRIDTLQRRLHERGHEALALPLSRIVEQTDAPAVRECLARLDRFDWIVPVSPAAVAALARMPGLRWPPELRVGVVGPGSLQAIADCGLPVARERVLAPAAAPFDADALIGLPPLDAPRGLRILVLRGESGAEGWIARLRAGGAAVQTCALYRREPIEPSDDALAGLRVMLAQAPAPVFVFTQVDGVARLDRRLEQAGLSARAHAAVAFAVHARIAGALARSGWRRVRLIEPGEPALVAALECSEDSPSTESV
ncbi:MAG: uroporphyrinogen-III synthase [Burkholderiaceae bacterium]|nr:uroporphyrinogen-III synthase [Burkholderiaceae bacterium]